MTLSFEKSPLASDRDAVFLYTASFLLSFGAGHWWVALPFIINHFQGTDTQVGLSLAANMGMYAVGVVVGTPLMIQFNLKRILQISTIGMACSTLLIFFIVFLTCRGYDLPYPNWLLIIGSALFGMSQAGFWPPLMGWLSIHCRNAQLNRRLSLFSISWSVASFLYPYSAGLLVEQSFIAPILVAVVGLILCCLAVSIPVKPQATEDPSGLESQMSRKDHPLQSCFCWMSRIALFASFLSFGISRTQFPIFFKVELHNSESIYGVFLMINSIAMFINYYGVGRTRAWHYRFSFLLVAQFCVLIFHLAVLYCTDLYPYYFVSILMGLGTAFCYSSHLYYGSASGSRRYAVMAIHEFTLASGYVIGSLIGGALSDSFDRLAPYHFGAGVITGSIMVQILIYIVFRSRQYFQS
ncbi:MAG: MFS transporter [Pirellulales bacterium]|nr:MFS transporter [Pirellulales bacterium]